MELNATLLIQALHFWIAYVIIDRILLRSGLRYIKTEDRKTALLEHNVTLQEQRIAEQTRHNEQDWLILQKRLRAECPEMRTKMHQSLEAELYEPEPLITRFPQAEAVSRLKELLVKKVLHGDR